jgi:hypothetical protein
MYKKVDECFTLTWYGLPVKLKVIQQAGCSGCFFSTSKLGCTGKDTTVPIKTGNCFMDARGDKTSVVFKEVKEVKV